MRWCVLVMACLSIFATQRTFAGNAACWGDDSRYDITCVKITESLLANLRGKSPVQVQSIMETPGRQLSENQVRYLSNFSKGEKGGSGSLNIIFEENHAVYISASVDRPNSSGSSDYIWSAFEAPLIGSEIDKATLNFQRKPFCSDLSPDYQSCLGGGMAGELTRGQMQFGMSKAEVLRMIEAACRMGGPDPVGDCRRMRAKFR